MREPTTGPFSQMRQPRGEPLFPALPDDPKLEMTTDIAKAVGKLILENSCLKKELQETGRNFREIQLACEEAIDKREAMEKERDEARHRAKVLTTQLESSRQIEDRLEVERDRSQKTALAASSLTQARALCRQWGLPVEGRMSELDAMATAILGSRGVIESLCDAINEHSNITIERDVPIKWLPPPEPSPEPTAMKLMREHVRGLLENTPIVTAKDPADKEKAENLDALVKHRLGNVKLWPAQREALERMNDRSRFRPYSKGAPGGFTTQHVGPLSHFGLDPTTGHEQRTCELCGKEVVAGDIYKLYMGGRCIETICEMCAKPDSKERDPNKIKFLPPPADPGGQ